MSELDRLDQLLRIGLEESRMIAPSHLEVQAVLRRASPAPARRRPARRFVLAATALVLVFTGTALAIPQAREAIGDAFGAFKSFFSGGEPPGQPVPADEPKGSLNWFTGSDRATGSVIAEVGAVRLVAYRNPDTGAACLGYGLAVDECRPDGDWEAELAKSSVVLRGPLPFPDGQGRLPLVGIVGDDVTRVEVRYADGSAERTTGLRNGFVVYADPDRQPVTLVASSDRDSVIEMIDVSRLQWRPSP